MGNCRKERYNAEGEGGGRGRRKEGPSPAAREPSSFSSSFISGTFYHATFR